jgi:rhomboid protease GluP
MWLRIPAERPRITLGILAVLVIIYLPALLSPRFYNEMLSWGANEKYSVIAGAWYRLITATLLHAPGFPPLHILLNGYALYAIGMELEALFGRLRFVYIYIVSGLAGSVASFIFGKPLVPSVGASGAIFGLIGALAVYYAFNRGLFGRMGTAMFWNIIIVIVVNLGIGFTPFLPIDNSAHLGGLIAGLATGFILCPRYKLGDWYNPLVRNLLNINRSRLAWVAAGLVGLIVVAIFLDALLLYRANILIP